MMKSVRLSVIAMIAVTLLSLVPSARAADQTARNQAAADKAIAKIKTTVAANEKALRAALTKAVAALDKLAAKHVTDPTKFEKAAAAAIKSLSLTASKNGVSVGKVILATNKTLTKANAADIQAAFEAAAQEQLFLIQNVGAEVVQTLQEHLDELLADLQG